MSTQIPLRIARSPAQSLRRQCLFERRTASSRPRCIAASPARAFSSTPVRPRKKERIGDTRMRVDSAKSAIAGQKSQGSVTGKQQAQDMAEDIGLLQNTIIRAPFSKLPSPTSWEFYSYFWTVVKSKFTALYTRSHFKRCVHKKGIASYLPVDLLKQTYLKNKAKKLYTTYYSAFAAGDVKTLRNICLTPLAVSSRSKIAVRGPIKMSWHLHRFKSARIMSHRCSPLGGDNPDSSYRQCVVCIESEQQLITSAASSRATTVRSGRAPTWAPGQAQGKQDAVSTVAAAGQSGNFKEKGNVETVVEYVVMQTRVIEGKEEGWKLWGFASESTPAKIEADEEYWKQMLNIQAQSA